MSVCLCDASGGRYSSTGTYTHSHRDTHTLTHTHTHTHTNNLKDDEDVDEEKDEGGVEDLVVHVSTEPTNVVHQRNHVLIGHAKRNVAHIATNQIGGETNTAAVRHRATKYKLTLRLAVRSDLVHDVLLAILVNLKLICISFVEGEVQQQTLGRLGTTRCELVPACLVKWVSHWNTLHTTETPQTVQVGVPLEHTAHYQNPTKHHSCSSLVVLCSVLAK